MIDIFVCKVGKGHNIKTMRVNASVLRCFYHSRTILKHYLVNVSCGSELGVTFGKSELPYKIYTPSFRIPLNFFIKARQMVT